MAPGEFRVDVQGIKEIFIDELGGKAADIKKAIFENNPLVFTGTKPTTEVILDGFITAFIAIRTIYKQGGLSSKSAYNTAHTNLLNCLLTLPTYVDGIAGAAVDKELVFKLSMMPYWDGVNNTAQLIRDGAVPVGLSYTPGATGIANVSCDSFGRGTKYFCFAVQGSPLPPGTTMSQDGQIILPLNAITPTCIVNLNGKRQKKLVSLVPKTDYYLYYTIMCSGVVSGLSLPLKIAGGN